MTENVTYEMAGLFYSRGEWIHPKRTISTYECILMLDGTAYIEENGKKYALQSGDLLLLEPDKPHSGYMPSSGKVSFLWAHFSGLYGATKLPKYTRPLCFDRLILLFRQLLHYANSPDYDKEAADLVMRLILTELEAEAKKKKEKSTSLYAGICEWCRTNSDRKITTADVAQHFGYNKDYLNRMFTKYGGCGLKEYISARRIEHIRSMLLSDITLKEIARRTGFDDYKDLLKFFRYHEGLTPTQFRNLYYNTHTNNK